MADKNRPVARPICDTRPVAQAFWLTIWQVSIIFKRARRVRAMIGFVSESFVGRGFAMDILFWNDDPEKALVLGPFSSVEKTADEIKVPIDLDSMDDEAERFFCEAYLIGIPFDNLLAVRQEGGTWELRELAGKWAYEVFENAEVLEN
ncbi:MAG TPA: hypothetical protein VMW54_13135 [Terriglobia bacterium]|nr:hypothetical protein [Terriglobia bacterium]